MRNGESAQYGGVPGYLKRLTIMSLFAAFVAVVGALWSEDWRAKRAGFSSGADKAAAEKSGISDPGVWKARLEADRQERDRLALEEITRNKERVEAEKATKRAMQISVLKTLAATPVKTDVKIDTIGAAKAAIGLWQDFENAARSIETDNPNVAERKIIEGARAKTKALKSATFPRIRKAFENFAGAKLWIDDYKISVSGNRSDVIYLIHHGFALNRNVQAANEAIYPTLNEFRFKRACYSYAKSTYANSVCYPVSTIADDQ